LQFGSWSSVVFFWINIENNEKEEREPFMNVDFCFIFLEKTKLKIKPDVFFQLSKLF
jgi:hypothetical protein